MIGVSRRKEAGRNRAPAEVTLEPTQEPPQPSHGMLQAVLYIPSFVSSAPGARFA